MAEFQPKNYTRTINGEETPIRCVETTIAVVWTLDEMATLITSEIGADFPSKGDHWPADYSLDAEIAKLIKNRRRAVALASSEVLASGEQVPGYRVGDNNWEHIQSAVRRRLHDLWGE